MWGPLPSSVSGGSLPPLPLSLTASVWLHPESPHFLRVNTGPQLLGTLDLRFCSGHSC